MRTDAERMGGRLEVTSGEAGRATTVTCEVPYERNEEAHSLARDRQTRVMLVDDHEIMRDGLQEGAPRAGDFEVVGQAGDGAAAVRVAQSLKPDVIIHGRDDTIKNGIDACREITEMLPDTRVLMLTASEEDDAVMEAIAAGAKGYLQKYSGKEKLLHTVRDVAEASADSRRRDKARVHRNPTLRSDTQDELSRLTVRGA